MELVSIIMPVYNERATLQVCVERVLGVDLGVERELIIVDDGSTDGSADVLHKLASVHAEIRPGFFKRNRGKGAAVKAALEVAKGTVAVVQDADLEYDPRDLPRILRPILEGRAEAVYGSRLAGGGEHRVLYYRHALGNRLITFVSNVLTDLNLTDVETGYKAFRLDLVKGLHIRSRGFTFEIEITAKLAALGARVYEVPVSYHGRNYQEGKKISWLDGIWAFLAAVRFRLFPGLGRGRLEARARVDVRLLPRFNRWLARKLLRWTGDRVVEYAPDVGTVTAHLARKERVVCVEPNADKAAFVKQRFGHRPNIRVLTGEFLEGRIFQALRAEDVDTVLCVNAIACIKDDEGLIREFGGVLEPGGKLVLFVPRGKWLYSPIDRARGYLRRYSRRYLYDKLVRAGFEVDRMRSFNRIGVVTWFVWGKLFRMRRAGGVLLGLYDRLTFLWRMLDWVLPLPGLSMIVVARKR